MLDMQVKKQRILIHEFASTLTDNAYRLDRATIIYVNLNCTDSLCYSKANFTNIMLSNNYMFLFPGKETKISEMTCGCWSESALYLCIQHGRQHTDKNWQIHMLSSVLLLDSIQVSLDKMDHLVDGENKGSLVVTIIWGKMSKILLHFQRRNVEHLGHLTISQIAVWTFKFKLWI